MFNGVGLKSTKGTGMSGYVERSRANMGGPSGMGSASLTSLEAQRNRKPPIPQREKRETKEAKVKMVEHLALRAIKVECAELKEKLRLQTREEEGGRLVPKFNEAEVKAQVDSLLMVRHKQYMSEKEERKKAGQGRPVTSSAASAPEPATKEDAKMSRFANAFGIDRSGQEEGTSAFDQNALRENKETRRVGRWQKLENKAEERVMEKLMKEQEGGGDNDAEDSRPAKKPRRDQ